MSAVGYKYAGIFQKYNKVSLIDICKDMFGKVWFLKRYHSNNKCTITKSKFICDCISDLIKIC